MEPRASGTALVLSAFVLGSCGPKPDAAERGRGVLVVAIDGLRADHLGAAGYDRDTTRTLDDLAAQGVLFLDNWSTAPEVVPAHVSLLTGTDPLLARRPQVKSGGPATELSAWFIPDALPRLAQPFLARGFTTGAFVDHPALSASRGFDRGFQEFAGFREESVPAGEYGFEGVATKFKNWLVSLEPAQDWFAYVHLDDLDRMWLRPQVDPVADTFFGPRPELSQVPPVAEGARTFFAIPRPRWPGGSFSIGEYEARYDGTLRHLDLKIARLFTFLRNHGVLDNTTVAIVGTHGVSFGESGLYLDSGTLSDADLRVPMIVRPARELAWAKRGVRVSRLTSILDLAPTLLDLAGLAVPKGMQGVSLRPFLEGRDEPVRATAFASGGLQEGTLVVDERYCLEISAPGRRGSAWLNESWYGDELDHAAETRRFLHDRQSSTLLGHLEDAAVDPAVEDRLQAATRQWFDWIDAARAVLHVPDFARTAVGVATAESLRARGLYDDGGR